MSNTHKHVWIGLVFFCLALLYGMPYQTGAEETASGCREPAVSGQFYSKDAKTLSEEITTFLSQADVQPQNGEVVAIMVPHAGYIFSAQIAAYAYKTVANKSIDTVILMGNAHRVGFRGISIDNTERYKTPLGEVEVDTDLVKQLEDPERGIACSKEPHIQEHSLEVQLPFLQKLFTNFKITPILFGVDPAGADKVLIEKLPKLLNGRKALLVLSTDLSHYPTYEDAVTVDNETLQAVLSMKPEALKLHIQAYKMKQIKQLDTVMCGSTSVMTGMEIAKAMGAANAVLLKYANSGDAANKDHSRVVGYGAIAFVKTGAEAIAEQNGKTSTETHNSESLTATDPLSIIPAEVRLTDEDKTFLLKVARETLETYIRTGKTPDFTNDSPRLKIDRGAFVTLNKQKQLRGCIGYIQPIKPLLQTVIENTIHAATEDFRFPKVTANELESITIEISALTPFQSITSPDSFVIGRDGIHMVKAGRSAVFLPQVAPEQGWTKEETLEHLSRKAGLPSDAWKEGAQFSIFQAEVFHEQER